MSASARLSVRLQDIAQSLAEVLDEVAGEPIALDIRATTLLAARPLQRRVRAHLAPERGNGEVQRP